MPRRLAFVLVGSSAAHAQLGVSLNRAGSGARAAGMANAFVAVSDDGTAASWNPAGLAQLRKPEFSLVYEVNGHGLQVSGIRSPDDRFAFSNYGFDDSRASLDFASATVPFTIAGKRVTVQLGWQRLYQLSGSLSAQVVAMFPYTEVLFPPGSRYGYSNPAVIFLGQIIERLTGEDYQVYVDKNILKPLEMHRSFFNRAPYHLVRHRSHGYFLDASGVREGRFDFDTGITTSNGGLNAPLGDMAKYLAFLMGRDDRREAYEDVLRRNSLEEMWRPVLPVSEEPEGRVSIGLAFFLEHRGGLDLVAHSGSQNGFISHFYLHPPSRLGYIVVFNTEDTREGEPTRRLDGEIRGELLRGVFPALAGPPARSR